MKLAPIFAVAFSAVLSGCLSSNMSGSQLEPNQFAATQTPADSSAILGMEGGGLVGGELGRAGTVRPAQPYRVGSQDCRQYTHVIQVNGGPREARGTACRNEDGSWMLLG